MIIKPSSSSAQKVQSALKNFGLTNRIVELNQVARTAAEASQAIGCQIGQIAKSLLFRTEKSKKPILIIVSGGNRVDEKKIGKTINETIEIADADFVFKTTGFAIGGVPPVGHSEPLRILIDKDLLLHKEIWAAGGHPRAVFKLTPDELVQITGGEITMIE